MRRTTMLLMLVMLCSWGLLLAQDPSEGIIENGDTLTIQPTYNGNPLNALNEWIVWDHDGDVENNPAKHSVYKLLRNSKYLVTAPVLHKGRLTLVADKPDLNNKPPQVGPAEDANGVGPGNVLMPVDGPFTLKNIWFTQLSFTSGSNSTMQTIAEVKVDSSTSYINGCYYEQINRWAFRSSGKWNSVYVTNCFYRNSGDESGKDGRGHFFISGGKAWDNVVFRNNTMINTPGLLINIASNMAKYIEIDHNTCINTLKRTVNIQNFIDGHVKNNIFYNSSSQGQLIFDIENSVKGCRDGLPVGIVDVDTLRGHVLDDTTWFDKESDRILEVANNWWGWTDNVLNFIDSDSELVHTPWMNTRTLAMFADDTSYPFFTEANTFSKDVNGFPNFVTPIQGTEDMILFIKNIVRGAGTEPLRWYWEPEGVENPNNDIEWPPIEDLRYDNAALIGDDGKPIGDLNWYEEYAERWDMTGWGRVTAVDNTNSAVPGSFSLEQNYPNPFNPETQINFSLSDAGNVKLTVYNILGEKVITLVDDFKTAGVHSVKWDGTNSAGQTVSSGFYFYRLQMDSQVLTKKMLLMK